MFSNIIVSLVPYVLKLLSSYISSSDSKKDDEILVMVQTGCSYLSEKDNNNLSASDAQFINNRSMTNQGGL